MGWGSSLYTFHYSLLTCRLFVHLHGQALERGGDGDGVGRLFLRQRAQVRGQPRQLLRRAPADVRECFGRGQAPATAHHLADQPRARAVVGLDGQDVARHDAARVVLAEDLLASGPGGLALRALAPRAAGVFLELVGAVEVGRVVRGAHVRADAEAVNRRAAREQDAHDVFIEIAAGEDAHLPQPAVVQYPAHVARVRREIAAVQAHGLDRDALAREARREPHDLLRRGLGVVGV